MAKPRRRRAGTARPARSSATPDSPEDVSQHRAEGHHRAPIKTLVAGQLRQGLAFGLAVIALLGGLTAWLGFRANADDETRRQREHFLEAGRASAIMLTTVKHNEVESDVKHIVDSSTGVFLEDFQKRTPSFLEIVRRTQADTEGTIAEAGLESLNGDRADVLVAVSVKTSLAGVDSPARLWRMRVAIQQVGGDMKLSNMEFIP
jgi:Mce-associated membrane protein